MVQNLRVPYRIGYTALAALRFVPRFGHELEVIRAAHRVRGTDARRGPVAAVRRAIRLRDPAARERDPARRAGRARHGRPCLRRAPHPHRAHPQPMAGARHGLRRRFLGRGTAVYVVAC